ncbi:MAG: DUF2304 domain-containing protein [Gammaproteobacteria bacterium]
MVVEYVPSSQTQLLVGLFTAFYLVLIGRKTLLRKIDIYDLFMLSMIAVIPTLFTFFPSFARTVAELAGVAFPFVVMFALLLTVLFILVHRLTVHMHAVAEQSRALIQEVGLLSLELRETQKNATRD